MTNAKKLRSLLNQDGIILAPGAYDSLSARLIESIGFPVVYVTGSGVTASKYALPDLGMITLKEMSDTVNMMVTAVETPIIVDADTGYGGVLNVRRTVREYENIGVAAIHLEDQSWPKKCGHFWGKQLISQDEMVMKIKAAIDSRQDPDFIIIARTDAIATEGFSAAVERGRAYRAAGADIIFLDVPESLDEIRDIPKLFDIPVMINMDLGKTPWMSASRLDSFGYKIAIYPGIPQLIALGASRKVLESLYLSGTIEDESRYRMWFCDFLALTKTLEAISWENQYDF